MAQGPNRAETKIISGVTFSGTGASPVSPNAGQPIVVLGSAAAKTANVQGTTAGVIFSNPA